MPWGKNPGHSLEVLPDVHPYEVDRISKGDLRGEKYAKLWRAGITSAMDKDCPSMNRNILANKGPTIFYHDGRATNQLAEYEFKRDPCKYYRNVYPWKPEGPKSYIPAKGHYDGLGKPPVRQFFKLTNKRVHETRVMPTYEVLDSTHAEHYYRDAV